MNNVTHFKQKASLEVAPTIADCVKSQLFLYARLVVTYLQFPTEVCFWPQSAILAVAEIVFFLL